ncbi:MAG TPA: hypothetical protein VFT96_02540 [Gemmatimonadaceae bacterium]|nr:hypothetical protein [Gemmatimonadaceae bacterium]
MTTAPTAMSVVASIPGASNGPNRPVRMHSLRNAWTADAHSKPADA